MFAETTTAGIRRSVVDRYALQRDFSSVETPYGPVRVKRFHEPGGESDFERNVKYHPEYDDCAALAMAENVPVREVMDAALRAVSSKDR